MMRGTPYVMRRRHAAGAVAAALHAAAVRRARRDRSQDRRRAVGGAARLDRGAARPDVAAQVQADWGSPNLGGAIVTAGGVVFIGAALDRSLHAYDIETGRELWHGALPASGKATPMSYRLASGEQYVAVAAGGGGAWGTGDHVVAFRLPR